MKRHVASVALLFACMAGLSPAMAQSKWTEIKRADSQLRLQMPGLTQSREEYAWTSDAQYIGINYSAFQAAPNADYPRGQSTMVRAFADASVQKRHTLDAAGIKTLFGMFADRSLTADPAPLPDPTGERQVRRFTVDGAFCVAFEVFPSGVDKMQLGGGAGTVAIIGYYCGPPGVPLTDSDIQWVLWGNEFVMPPGNTYVRLAAAPATPPSERLRPSGSAALSQAMIEQVNGGFAAYNRKDYAAAMQSWRPLADQGVAIGQMGLGLLYMNGEGVAKNPTEAVNWFRKAADQGEVNAEANLGRAYRNGTGVARNLPEALKWLRKAADQGNVGALYDIGVMYANGQGVTQSYPEAKKWLELALEKIGPEDQSARNQIAKDRDQIVARMAEPKKK